MRVQASAPAASADSNGTVVSSASTPNVMSIGRRPMRSDSAPISGCSSMKRNSDGGRDESSQSPFVSPTVFDEELLHVRREDVEEQRAAHRQPDDDQHLARVLQQKSQLRRRIAAGLDASVNASRLGRDCVADTEPPSAASRADDERNAPAPGFELFVSQRKNCSTSSTASDEQLTHDERDVQNAGIEAALVPGAISLMYVALVPYSPPTLKPCSSRAKISSDRRRDRRSSRSRRGRDHQRAEAHQHHRQSRAPPCGRCRSA